MRLAFVILLSACTTSVPEAPTPLDACPTCGAGEVRYGLVGRPTRSGSGANLDVRDGGFAYVAGYAIYMLDDTLAIGAQHPVGTSDVETLAVACRGAACYVVDQDPRLQQDNGKLNQLLFAYDSDAERLWIAPLAPAKSTPIIVADVLGPYIGVLGKVSGFDLDGNQRTSFTAARPLDALGPGGIITATDASSEVTFADLFPTGPERWSTVWKIDGTVQIVDAAASATEVAVVGRFDGASLNLAGTVVASVAPTTGFVAVLSLDGTLQWVTPLPQASAGARIAITSDHQVVITDHYTGDGTPLGLPPADFGDSYVALVDHSGIVRLHLLGGHGDQIVGALRRGPADTVVVTVASESGQLAVGSHTFEHAGARDYVIELLP